MNPLYNLFEKLFDFNNQRLLFKNIDKKNLNELEQRVQMSVNCFGLSLRNNNLLQRLLILSISLETLLSTKKVCYMDTFFIPSKHYNRICFIYFYLDLKILIAGIINFRKIFHGFNLFTLAFNCKISPLLT